MDLKHRLRRLLGEAGPDPQEPAGREALEPEGNKIIIPGRKVEHPLGSFWLRTVDHPLATLHGRKKLEAVLQVDAGRLKVLTSDPGLEHYASERAIFIDTETTSLAGGAGVYVFMAGIGFMHQGQFRVEQYFMRDYDEEPAMLTAFNDRVSGFNAMVSFFGKNFDRYRLEDRMCMLGIKSALPVLCHLDLYHVGRRLYKGRFPDLKLKTIEEFLLGVEREGDIPGAECPEAYFQYLRGMDDGRMADVFYHNLQDILSLVTLTTEVDDLAANPGSAIDRYMMACVYLKGGLPDRARPLLDEVYEDLPPGPTGLDALLKRAMLLKGAKQYQPLEETLRRLLDLDPGHSAALTEMAKHLEHTCKDFEKALSFALQARIVLEGKDAWHPSRARLIKDIDRRIDRLKKKNERSI